KLKGLKASVEELRAMQKPIYEKLFKEKAKPMPGVLALIRRLRKRGVPLAVVSSNYRYNIELALRKFGMLEDFKVIISCEDCRRIKPDPEPYLRAVEKLGCAPQEVIVVEDAEKGVESAKAAGCKCIAIPNHYTAHGDFSKADAVVKKFSDINSKLLAKF
ncbi:MAG: HAD family phosphatase, partial [Candidatus Diapherotrites archaeon]|nr:HAD family phosphatase [Candidatus Diapherotrites archaeon]